MASRTGVVDSVLRKFLLKDVVVTGSELGAGYYSKVLELEYMGTKCAGKKLHKELYKHKGCTAVLERFATECKLLSELRHPHIVQFLGLHLDKDSDVPLLVMEYLPSALSDCIEQYGIMPSEVCYTILLDVAVGMNFLHNRSPPIIHRDLTANNVLLSSNMSAKISDLGMAKIIDLAPAQRAEKMTVCPGTVSYMPPEAMVASPSYDTKLDCFSYGVLMLHIFSGFWPIPKEYLQQDPHNPNYFRPLTEIQRREQYLLQLGSDHPLSALIKQCLSNVPSERPTMTKILATLRSTVVNFSPSYSNSIEMLKKIALSCDEKQKLIAENENFRQLVTKHGIEVEKVKWSCKVELEAVKDQLSKLELLSDALAAENNELKICNTHLQDCLTRKEEELKILHERIALLTKEVDLMNKTIIQRAQDSAQKFRELQELTITRNEERDETLQKLKTGSLSTSLVQFQNSQSDVVALCENFEDLFLNNADEMAECIEKCTSLPHMESQYLVCDLVQTSYEQCQEAMQKLLNIQLAKLYKFDLSRTKSLHDIKLAFGLLKNAVLADCLLPQLDVSDQVLESFLKKHCKSSTNSVNEYIARLQKHLSDVSRLTWRFVSCTPPLVLCRPSQFQEEWQDREFLYWNKGLKEFKLMYTRPVLFHSCDGGVGVKGWVGNSMLCHQK